MYGGGLAGIGAVGSIDMNSDNWTPFVLCRVTNVPIPMSHIFFIGFYEVAAIAKEAREAMQPPQMMLSSVILAIT